MLSSLCPVMTPNPSVSRFLMSPPDVAGGRGASPGAAGSHARWNGGFRHRTRSPEAAGIDLILGFHAASWQHRYLDCGTLISERSLPSRHPLSREPAAVARKEPPVAGACMVGEVLG
jgi:hypothetical protein